MSLQTALSGIQGAQTGLDTVSNDLANASTTAYKNQNALFSDIYKTSETDVPGIGVATEQIQEDFSQGNITTSGSPLNAALQGLGFFTVNNAGTQQYTRDGSFQLSTDGSLVTASGAKVLGFVASADGTSGGGVTPITINTGAVAAKPTTNLGLTLDLNANDAQISTAFSPTDPTTYDEATSVVAYDSLGNANRLDLYFAQVPTTGSVASWTVYAQPTTSDGVDVGTPQTLTTLAFNSDGSLASGSPATLSVAWGNGAANSNINVDLTGTTTGAQNFAVAGTTNDGYPPGGFTSASINDAGEIQAIYSNGQTVSAGTLAIANFINQEGLNPVTGNYFAATNTSGQPVLDAPGDGQAGQVKGGYLEQSNASTSSLLVSLIQYQQAYQANTSVIQTEQQDSQRLVQI